MEVGHVLVDILVVLVVAKCAAEISLRIGAPTVAGELVAGILIGPSLLGWVEESAALAILAELGVLLLLVEVGMQMEIGDLGSVGRPAVAVAVVGVALPFVGGWIVSSAFGVDPLPALFVGASLTATSVGITARVFTGLQALGTRAAKIVLGAAVVDDVVGLVILTVMTGVAVTGVLSVTSVLRAIGLAIAFLIVATYVGVKVVPRLFDAIYARARADGILVALTLIFVLLVATGADAAGLAPAVGAFVAGLALGPYRRSDAIESSLEPVGHLLIPVFFLGIGISADVVSFLDPGALVFALALLAVAIVGKVLSGYFAGRDADGLLVGFGMLPRGEVGLIFASLGLREAILGEREFGVLLFVVLVTTVLAPPLLKMRLHRMDPVRSSETPA